MTEAPSNSGAQPASRHAATPRGPSPRALLTAMGGLAGLLALVDALPSASRLALVLGFMLLGPGGAVLIWWRGMSPALRAVLTPLSGISIVVLVTTVQVFAKWWTPRSTLAVLSVVALASAVAYALTVARKTRRDDVAVDLTPTGLTLATDPGAEQDSRTSLWGWDNARSTLVLVAAALASWAVALPFVGSSRASAFSLLFTCPPMAVALVLAVAAGFTALRRRSVTGTLAVTVVVVLIERFTASIGTPVALYPWTYKHLGVVDFIDRYGYVVRGVDIYHSWPGMFAASAWVHELSGVSVETLAHWFTPLYHLGLVGVVYGTARAWRLTPIQAAATALVLEVASFIAQDYFSPQALAYLLAFAVLAVLGESTRRRVAAFPALIVFAAIVVTHQLTPYWLLMVVAALVVLRRTKPWWLPVLFAGMAGAFLYWNYSIVTKFGVIASPDPLNNVRLTAAPVPELGYALGFYCSIGSYLVCLGVTGLVVLRRLLTRGEWRTPAALGLLPVLLLAVQGYGGEAIFRVFLFALPGAAAVLAVACLAALRRRSDVSGRTRALALTAAVIGTALAFFSANTYLSSWTVYRVSPSQIGVWTAFNRDAPVRAYFLTPAPGFPSNPEWYYVNRVTQNGTYIQSLFGGSLATKDNLSSQESYETIVDAIEETYRPYGAPVYLAVSDNLQNYAQIVGVLPPDFTRNLRDHLLADPRWTLIADQGSADLFRLSLP